MDFMKTGAGSSIERYKARLVQGFTQKYGTDYETVVRLESFHTTL